MPVTLCEARIENTFRADGRAVRTHTGEIHWTGESDELHEELKKLRKDRGLMVLQPGMIRVSCEYTRDYAARKMTVTAVDEEPEPDEPIIVGA